MHQVPLNSLLNSQILGAPPLEVLIWQIPEQAWGSVFYQVSWLIRCLSSNIVWIVLKVKKLHDTYCLIYSALKISASSPPAGKV